MNGIKKIYTDADEWASLKQFTSARIALGKTGISIPVKESLRLKLAHAQAKDAVYTRMDKQALTDVLTNAQLPAVAVHSKADNRDVYLQRPDLGRKLNEKSVDLLKLNPESLPDIVIIIADGLSAAAINKQAAATAILLAKEVTAAGFSLAPVILAEQARVAIGDEIAELLNARLSIILIGERPGLTSFESMGAYITYQPRIGTTDERRNCISNIQEDGLSPIMAATTIVQLVKAAFAMQLTGVGLKEGNNADSSSLFHITNKNGNVLKNSW